MHYFLGCVGDSYFVEVLRKFSVLGTVQRVALELNFVSKTVVSDRVICEIKIRKLDFHSDQESSKEACQLQKSRVERRATSEGAEAHEPGAGLGLD